MKKYQLIFNVALTLVVLPSTVFAVVDPINTNYIYDNITGNYRAGRAFDATQKPGVANEKFLLDQNGVYDVDVRAGAVFVHYYNTSNNQVVAKYNYNNDTGDLNEAWKYQSSYHAVGDYFARSVRRMAFDSGNNIYIAGSNIDKISSNGAPITGEQWPKVMFARSVAVDGNNHVLVTLSGSSNSYKYDSAGNLISDQLPAGNGIVADSAGVAYIRDGSSMKRINSNGSIDASWQNNGTRTYTCGPHTGACSFKMITDSQNNLYVVNFQSGPSNPSGYFYVSGSGVGGMIIEKFNASGALVWMNNYPAQYFPCGGYGFSTPYDMKLDSQSNLVVMVNEYGSTASCANDAGYRGPITFYKIAPDGQRIWHGTYRPALQRPGGPLLNKWSYWYGFGSFGLAQDGNGKDLIYVAGSYGNGKDDMVGIANAVFFGGLQMDSPPVAVAKISTDGVTFGNSITVGQDATTTIYLSAEGSSDPDGWTNTKFGVSNGGKCEWNTDLDTRSASSTFETVIDDPATPEACLAGPFEVKFSSAGTSTITALRITDAARVSSDASVGAGSLQIVVVPKPNLIISVAPSIDSGSAVAGSSITFKATVRNTSTLKNISTTFKNHFKVNVNNDANPANDIDLTPDPTIASLLAGASQQIISGSWTAVAGTHRVTVCADQPDNAIDESREDDNCNDSSGAVGGGVVTVNPVLRVYKNGNGVVRSSGLSIDCGATCSTSVSSGTNVTLTATPNALSQFTGWSGCTSTSGNVCHVTVLGNTDVTATFDTAPACSDGSDNDLDGSTDADDPGCDPTNPNDNDETDPPPPDTTNPTKPTNVQAVVSGANCASVQITWTAGSDNVGVAGYNVYFNGVKINTPLVAGTSYTDTAVPPDTANILYSVETIDSSGNSSGRQDASSTITTPACTASSPDLTTTRIQSAPNPITAGRPVIFTATVTNQGSDALAFHESFIIDILNDGNSANDVTLSPRPVNALAAGDTTTVTSPTWYNTIIGTHRVIACADSAGAIPESDENNNCTNSPSHSDTTIGVITVRRAGDGGPL
jgi:hypothetical protein